MLSGGCLLSQVSRRSMFELQADCANSRCSIRMPPRRVNKGAFGKGNQGYGLRNAAVDAADEPDAGARANECPLCRTCTRTHATHTSAHAHAHTHTHTHAHTHARTLQLTAKHTPTAKHCAVSLIQAWLAVHGRFDRFSGVQGTSGLRI